MPNKLDLTPLKTAYAVPGSLAEAFFDALAARVRCPKDGVTTVTHVQQWLYERSFTQSEMTVLFQLLMTAGVGSYIRGRGDRPHRVSWAVNPLALARVVAGRLTELRAGDWYADRPETSADEPADASPEIAVQLRLRIGVTARVEGLPDDLSQQEADRLAQFIRTIPLSA